jgi:hypothetical protein
MIYGPINGRVKKKAGGNFGLSFMMWKTLDSAFSDAYILIMKFQQLVNQCESILKTHAALLHANSIGTSRQGRNIHGFCLGSGSVKVSLIAGCHADEPVGPLLLTKFVNYLHTLPQDDPLLVDYTWFIIPHTNPDGKTLNDKWWQASQETVDLIAYLTHRVRELPGDDMEFGFPRLPDGPGVRIENTQIYRWWRRFGTSFDLHASLHGMGFAAGPWYLIEEAWKDRIDFLKTECLRFVEQNGYRPHDVDRQGEKGFFRLEKGFCARPDSGYMRRYFVEQGDERTASLFYPSSMETMRSFGGDSLTIVSEMPLFLLPDVGLDIGPPDQAALQWNAHLDRWQNMLDQPGTILEESQRLGLKAMPVRDQMLFQWHFMCAALEQIHLLQ